MFGIMVLRTFVRNPKGVSNMQATNARFIERDYYKQLIETNSELLTDIQIEKILHTTDSYWLDLTFKFFEDGSLVIIDNHTEQNFPLKDLKGAAFDFYVKQRIMMIRAHLKSKVLQTA
jgi:hypothetical protein